MAGAGKLLAGLGAVVVAAVAAGVWLVMSDPPADEAGETVAVASAGPDVAKPEKGNGARKSGRKHAKVVGASSVIGTVTRRQGAEPAAGQVVTLTREGMDPWSAEADAAGSFRIPDLPEGGPYELGVEAKGCGTIRLPGLVLTRGEALDVGTLWLDLAVRVTVSVRTWGDVPIEGAEVEAFAAPDWSRGFDWTKAQALLTAVPVGVAKVTTGADGKAVFPEMASGVWTFTAKKPGLARDGRSNVRFEGGSEPPEVKIFLATGHTLKGRVLDGDRRPIADAAVLGGRGLGMYDYGAAPLRNRAKSDAEGKYELTGLPTGDIALMVGAPGGIPYQIAVVRVPAVQQYDLVIKSGGTLTGVVTESGTGKPVEGAVVRANSYGNRVQRMAEATTDATGRYLIPAVADGPVNDVSVSKDGWLQDRSEDSPMGRQLQLNPGDTVSRDLKMKQGAKVTGVITGAQGPISGARVQLWTGSPDRGVQQSKSAVTDSAGKYELSPVERGKGMIQVVKEGWIQKGLPENWWQAVQQGTVPPQYTVDVPEKGEVKLDVALDQGARIEGKVEADGVALAGVTVSLYGNRGQQTAKSGADGTFVLTGAMPAPKVTLMPQKEGFVAAKNEPVEVLADAPTTGVVLKMLPQRMIRGTATSATGQPLRDAQVSVTMKQAAGAMGGRAGMAPGMVDGTFGVPGQGTAPVREDGSFELPIPWAEGSVAVRAVALDHAPGESTAVPLVETQTEYEANVVLEAGYAVRGRVAAKGVGLAGADVSLAPGRGGSGVNRMGPQMYYPGMNQAGGTVVAVTDGEGTFTIDHVATGTYAVSASAEGHIAKSIPEVKVPTAGDVTIDLDASLEIAGKVLFSDGRAAAGAIVMAQKDDPANKQQNYGWWGGGPQGIAGADGSFRVRGLSPGGWKLTAQAPWDGSVNFKNAVTEPVTAGTADYKIVVQAGGKVTGKVVDPDKKPVSGSWVYANPTTPTPNSGNEWHAARTKDDGAFELTSLGDGPFTVSANPPQFGDGANLLVGKADNVAAGATDLEIVLEAGLAIEGSVTDAQGKPLPDAGLYIQSKPDPQGRRPQMNGNRQQTQTDADGKFKFQGLGPGRYMIQLWAWGGNRYEGLLLLGNDDIAAGTADLRLTATTGEKIAGVVVDEAGNGLAGAQVYANPPSGMGRNGRSDKDGKFEVTGLPRGTVNVNAQMQGRPPVQIAQVETGSLVLRIVIPKGGQITGRAVDGAGNAYAGQNLQLKQTSGGSQMHWVHTGADGRFTSQLIIEGAWDVLALRKGAEGKQEWVKVGTARTGENVELTIP